MNRIVFTVQYPMLVGLGYLRLRYVRVNAPFFFFCEYGGNGGMQKKDSKDGLLMDGLSVGGSRKCSFCTIELNLNFSSSLHLGLS